MDAELRYGTPDESIQEGWECPHCGTQLGHTSPHAVFTTPPTCRMGHGPVEMEQILRGRFGSARQQPEGDDQ
jgi:hypothetical protein